MLEFLATAAGAAGEAAHDAAQGGEHAEAAAFGFLTPGMVVALAMLVVFAIMWRAGVPKMITGGLDARIDTIRKQLAEAARLRDEAAALKAQYEEKSKAADGEIAVLQAAAQRQADDIVAKAKVDAKNLIERRKKMAEDKIAAAEREAIDAVRRHAANAAAEGARKLIAEKHGPEADAGIADKVIAAI